MFNEKIESDINNMALSFAFSQVFNYYPEGMESLMLEYMEKAEDTWLTGVTEDFKYFLAEKNLLTTELKNLTIEPSTLFEDHTIYSALAIIKDLQDSYNNFYKGILQIVKNNI